MNIYKCCRSTRDIMLSTKNLFKVTDPDIFEPEDIKFYREGEMWFNSTYHEEDFCINSNATKDDLEFFKELGVIG